MLNKVFSKNRAVYDNVEKYSRARDDTDVHNYGAQICLLV